MNAPLDGHSGSEQRTISLPRCDEHPPLREWSMKNLIQGICPACGGHVAEGEPVARELKARRAIEERGL